MIVLVALALIGFGAVCIFGQDMLWEWTVFNNQWEGRASEHSELWELRTACSGLLAIGVGIAVLVMFFFRS